jgi:hypothetical protein
MSVIAERDSENRIEVTSSYWQIGIDLGRGGTIDSVVFPYGSGRNLIVNPFHISVDGVQDIAGPVASSAIEQTDHGVRIVCTGDLGEFDGSPKGISYRHVYEMDDDVCLIRSILSFEQEIRARTIGVSEASFSSTLDEFGYRPSPWDDELEGGKWSRASWGRIAVNAWPVVESDHIPVYLMLFKRYVEGFDWSPFSKFGQWEEQLSGSRGQSYFRLLGQKDRQCIDLECKVLQAREPIAISPGSYEYAYYFGLPKIMERTPRKWYHIAFGNHPWPSDATIEKWAEAGVNVARLHNDYVSDGDFWHDGAWPPYGEEGMKELRRVIGACHEQGIKVVPYFSVHELHPISPGYEHVDEWCRTMAPDQTAYHNHVRNGEYGVQMCPQSDWLNTLKANVEKAYRELSFDGIYYDWMHYMPCMNASHSSAVHTGVDGVIEMGRWTRDLIEPDGILILHIYGDFPSIPIGNMADLLVCMEETSNQETIYYHWQSLPLATVLGETVPRCPCPPYRRDHNELRTKSLIAQLSVMGMFQCQSSDQALRFFSKFSRYPLQEYAFRGPWTKIVETSESAVAGAIYFKSEHAVIVLSNTQDTPASGVQWRLNLVDIGWAKQDKYHLVAPDGDYESRDVSAEQLSGNGLVVSLSPLEYVVIEIEPATVGSK